MSAPTRRTLEQAADAWLDGREEARDPHPVGHAVQAGGDPRLRGRPAPVRAAGLRRPPSLRAPGADLQWLVDRLVGNGHSASKIHNVLMPVRSICRHAIERDELAMTDASFVYRPRTVDVSGRPPRRRPRGCRGAPGRAARALGDGRLRGASARRAPRASLGGHRPGREHHRGQPLVGSEGGASRAEDEEVDAAGSAGRLAAQAADRAQDAHRPRRGRPRVRRHT